MAGAAGDAAPNRLIQETSPYLRLHAHNPVDWYPWGEEAIAKARREQKPIFLSVGYSTCYWCHVMEREVFSDPAIAELMNRWFVNIKVDREERPEIDEIYMTATRLLTRSGGWPNSVFLTPDLDPFYAGTYFPPEDRGGRPGFPRILESLHEAWTTRRPEIEGVASRLGAAIRESLGAELQTTADVEAVASIEVAARTANQLKESYDSVNGGFGSAQKFPSPSSLFLLWELAGHGDAEARRMVLETLLKMGRGAIYDQLDGGFHRYTLDAAWRIPHFEKMLYDNAHLGELLAVTAAATGNPALERLARGTFDWVLEEMTLPNGAFKSAIDAETDAVEGAFYIWTEEELRRALGEEGFDLLAPIYGFDGEPNFEGDHYT
ncbi:MAG: thioredoxin domain-containing protein [Acidobacteria bacterium]|nr:MAG: thioredoxin domain-containing protein [Acidobacteriota bacterium]